VGGRVDFEGPVSWVYPNKNYGIPNSECTPECGTSNRIHNDITNANAVDGADAIHKTQKFSKDQKKFSIIALVLKRHSRGSQCQEASELLISFAEKNSFCEST